MFELCAPALIYIAFSLTQIIIDTLKGLYNTSLVKFIVMIMITILLNALCQRGLGIASWIIVFIPFVMMTVITSVLLYIFGLNAATGTFNYNQNTSDTSNCNKNVYTDKNGNIIIYNPYYDAKNKPVYYNSPNVIVPAPPVVYQTNTNTNQQTNQQNYTTATNVTTISTPSLTNFFNSTSPAFTWA
jgi:hypothetical protein